MPPISNKLRAYSSRMKGRGIKLRMQLKVLLIYWIHSLLEHQIRHKISLAITATHIKMKNLQGEKGTGASKKRKMSRSLSYLINTKKRIWSRCWGKLMKIFKGKNKKPRRNQLQWQRRNKCRNTTLLSEKVTKSLIIYSLFRGLRCGKVEALKRELEQGK